MQPDQPIHECSQLIHNYIAYKKDAIYVYPTKTQYTTVISGLLNHLGVEHDTKKMVSELDQYSLHGYEYSSLQNSWREPLISKLKKERQNLVNDEVLQIKIKYSNENSGRKLKGYSMAKVAGKKIQKNITMVSCSSGNTNQMEKIAEAAKIGFENNSYDAEELNHLWIQTYAYRLEFVKNSTTQDIIKQFPAYSNPYRLFSDIKMLTGVDLQNSVQEKMEYLATKLCTNNQYPTDNGTIRCFKILCGMLNDSWKHYLRFYPEMPVTPLPIIQVEDDHLNVCLAWTFICSSKSIEESIAVLIGLYSLMDLKFNTYRTTARFLYVYLMNDQQKQPNNISKIFKEHNIELEYKSTSSVQLERQSPSFVEKIKEINNNNDIFLDDRDDSVHDLIIDVEENEAEEINAEIPTSKTILMKSTSKPSQKRKSANLTQNTDLAAKENIPRRKKRLTPNVANAINIQMYAIRQNFTFKILSFYLFTNLKEARFRFSKTNQFFFRLNF
ncbi:unnamed protein product [Rotaria sp. Silwood2]|nr:unnamed protein product [Rotaria sp. Silwood2]